MQNCQHNKHNFFPTRTLLADRINRARERSYENDPLSKLSPAAALKSEYFPLVYDEQSTSHTDTLWVELHPILNDLKVVIVVLFLCTYAHTASHRINVGYMPFIYKHIYLFRRLKNCILHAVEKLFSRAIAVLLWLMNFIETNFMLRLLIKCGFMSSMLWESSLWILAKLPLQMNTNCLLQASEIYGWGHFIITQQCNFFFFFAFEHFSRTRGVHNALINFDSIFDSFFLYFARNARVQFSEIVFFLSLN